jgi:hypothetical protein
MEGLMKRAFLASLGLLVVLIASVFGQEQEQQTQPKRQWFAVNAEGNKCINMHDFSIEVGAEIDTPKKFEFMMTNVYHQKLAASTYKFGKYIVVIFKHFNLLTDKVDLIFVFISDEDLCKMFVKKLIESGEAPNPDLMQ